MSKRMFYISLAGTLLQLSFYSPTVKLKYRYDDPERVSNDVGRLWTDWYQNKYSKPYYLIWNLNFLYRLPLTCSQRLCKLACE
jgi:hypothetical protein